jgi:dTDP-4-dehydrorhamnose reductase
MRVVITGSSGQLGCELRTILEPVHEIVLMDLPEFDVTNPCISDVIAGMEPGLVIHAAAMTDVDRCETCADQAYQANAFATRNIALACKACGARMIYVSTNYIFDGAKDGPYIESDIPNPVSVYGRSKLVGEWYVQDTLSDYIIARTAWLYSNRGRNFVSTMLRLAGERDALNVVDDQYGSPTWARDLAEGITALAGKGIPGVYHLTNSGICSWYEWAKAVFDIAGEDHILVSPIPSSEYPRSAAPPTNGEILNVSAANLGVTLRPWRAALEECVKLRLAGQA